MSSIYASDSADDLSSLFSVKGVAMGENISKVMSQILHERAWKLVCDATRHTSAHFLLLFVVSFFFYI